MPIPERAARVVAALTIKDELDAQVGGGGSVEENDEEECDSEVEREDWRRPRRRSEAGEGEADAGGEEERRIFFMYGSFRWYDDEREFLSMS